MSFLHESFSAGVWGEKTPTAPQQKKWIHRNLSDNHCPECLKLHECWFLRANAPRWPHHPFCHCILEDIPYNDVLTKCRSVSAYSKFDPYLFNPEGKYPHKKSYLTVGGILLLMQSGYKQKLKNKGWKSMLTVNILQVNQIITVRE